MMELQESHQIVRWLWPDGFELYHGEHVDEDRYHAIPADSQRIEVGAWYDVNELRFYDTWRTGGYRPADMQ